jgi:hypothetical protein
MFFQYKHLHAIRAGWQEIEMAIRHLGRRQATEKAFLGIEPPGRRLNWIQR